MIRGQPVPIIPGGLDRSAKSIDGSLIISKRSVPSRQGKLTSL